MERVNLNWLEEIDIRLSAQQSNVVLISSSDYIRISELISFLSKTNAEIYVADISVQKLYQLISGQKNEVSLDTSLLAKIDSLLRRNVKTFVIIINAYLSHYVNLLNDYLLHWSQDSELYKNESKVFVFTDTSLYSALLRRLIINIEVPISLPEERKAIILNSIKKLNIQADNIDEVINITAGLNLYEVSTATLLSVFKHKALNIFEYRQFKTEILNNYGIEFVQPSRGFESIGGYDFLKQYVTESIILPLKNPDLARSYGIAVPKGVILFGPPGTGKTYFVKALAKEVSLPLLQLDPSTFLRGIVGETEQRVKQIQQIVESLAPCILFIDEIDQLFMGRANIVSTDSGVSRRMISMMLTWFGDESRKSIIIGTTNYIESIDEAFLRPGRIDSLIPVLYPDYDARLQILTIHAKNKPVDTEALKVIAEKTAFYTSAELAYIIEKSLRKAFIQNVKVNLDLLSETMKSIQIDIEERKKLLNKYKTFLKNVNLIDSEAFDRQVNSLMKEISSGIVGRGI